MSDLFDLLDPTDVEVMDALQLAVGEGFRVGIPAKVAKVEKVDPPRITATPLIQRQDPDAPADPGIKGVPVAVMSSGGVVVSLPVSVGDLVWLMVGDRELDGWIAKGGKAAVQAQDPRTHDLADVVAYPMDIGSLPSGAAGKFWLGGAAVPAILEGLSIKFGKLATQALIRGNIFNAAHLTMLSAVSLGFSTVAVFLGAIVTATSALPAPVISLAQIEIWARAVGAAAFAAGLPVSAAALAISAVFLPAQSTWLSTKVSTE